MKNRVDKHHFLFLHQYNVRLDQFKSFNLYFLYLLINDFYLLESNRKQKYTVT